jgi:phage/plasmid-associated DNA primase
VKRYEYRGNSYTINELSFQSGIAPATLRDRLRRGYSVDQALKITATHDSIQEFTEASWWEDWIGMPMSDLFEIYWRWCVANGYAPVSKQRFSKHLFQIYPNLKVVPKNGVRIIREK